jgi:hypothetical protein
MTTLFKALTGQRRKLAIAVAVVLAAAALGGWAVSGRFVPKAFATRDGLSAELKPTLVGSYTVTGTDTDGKRYSGAHVLNISLAPSGALELEWDYGKQVGVGEIIGDVLAVSGTSGGRSVIMTMTINQNGTLSGTWLRRTDRGAKGTEIWKKK